MAALKKEVKLYIVRALAMFNTPQETVELVQQEFGIKLTRQKCEAYDPTKRTGQNLSQELKEEFEATREQYLASPKTIPIANEVVRLQRYENEFQRTKNPKLRLEILKQAAEEIGGKYTNQQKIDSKVEQSGDINHKHSIDLPDNIAELNAQELAKLYFAKS